MKHLDNVKFNIPTNKNTLLLLDEMIEQFDKLSFIDEIERLKALKKTIIYRHFDDITECFNYVVYNKYINIRKEIDKLYIKIKSVRNKLSSKDKLFYKRQVDRKKALKNKLKTLIN